MAGCYCNRTSRTRTTGCTNNRGRIARTGDGEFKGTIIANSIFHNFKCAWFSFVLKGTDYNITWGDVKLSWIKSTYVINSTAASVKCPALGRGFNDRIFSRKDRNSTGRTFTNCSGNTWCQTSWTVNIEFEGTITANGIFINRKCAMKDIFKGTKYMITWINLKLSRIGNFNAIIDTIYFGKCPSLNWGFFY